MKALIILAHGSRRQESNQEIKNLTSDVRTLIKKEFDIVDYAFLEIAKPSLINSIKNVEIALGKEIKAPTKIEIKNKIFIRKSLIALKPINKGDIFTKYNVGAKRPGTGISPMKINELLGRRAKRNFVLDELIK